MPLHKGTSEGFCQGKAPDFQEYRVTTLQWFANPAQLQELSTPTEVSLLRIPGNVTQV
jgi:hypothetical protein